MRGGRPGESGSMRRCLREVGSVKRCRRCGATAALRRRAHCGAPSGLSFIPTSIDRPVGRSSMACRIDERRHANVNTPAIKREIDDVEHPVDAMRRRCPNSLEARGDCAQSIDRGINASPSGI